MSAPPRVSVLMSVYNGARYLREAVDSILDQTFSDFEYIVIDDGSTDETPAILDSYNDPRIVLLRNQSNMGLTKSLNRGLAVVEGEYVARQDADDVSYPDRLARQIAFLDANRDIALVGTAYVEMYEDGRPSRPVSVPLMPEDICNQLFYHHCFCHGSVMFRRSCVMDVGGYNQHFSVAQDRDLWLRMADHFALANIASELYLLRISTQSVTGTSRTRQRQAAHEAVQNALERGLLRPHPIALARFFWQRALDEISTNNFGAVSEYIQQAIAVNPRISTDADWLGQCIVHRAYEEALLNPEACFNYDKGFGFIDGLVYMLPSDLEGVRTNHRRMRGQLGAAFAFAAAQHSDPINTRRFCYSAWKSHWSQWQNRGLFSVFFHSFQASDFALTRLVL